jgi:hypothetical protein
MRSTLQGPIAFCAHSPPPHQENFFVTLKNLALIFHLILDDSLQTMCEKNSKLGSRS